MILNTAYYVNSGNDPLPWKISWDPTRSSDTDYLSEEIIKVDGSVSTEVIDPDTQEIRWNAIAQHRVPLRHTVFAVPSSGSYASVFKIWVSESPHSATTVTWQAVNTPVSEVNSPFTLGLDIPLTEELEGVDVARRLERNSAIGSVGGLDWNNVRWIRIQLIYIGDYVIPKSFQQDLHPNANVELRKVKVDLDLSTDNVRSFTQHTRSADVLVDFKSPFLQGEDVDASGQSTVGIGKLRTHEMQAQVPAIRTGIHQIQYSERTLTEAEQSHSGSWPAAGSYTYRQLNVDDVLESSHENFIMSYRQSPRTSSAVSETTGELILQYDNSEGWQAGTSDEAYRREVDTASTPKIARRYPLLARFAQGKDATSHTGFLGTVSDMPEPLNLSPNNLALVTTQPGRPDLLRRHSTLSLRLVGDQRSFEGMSQLRLFKLDAEGLIDDSTPWINYRIGAEGANRHLLLDAGSGSEKPNYISSTWTARQALSSGDTRHVTWRLQVSGSGINDAFYRLQAGSRTLIHAGLAGYNTNAITKNFYFGSPADTGIYNSTPRSANRNSLFDIVVRRNIFPRIQGNMAVENILDTYGDFTLGRNRSGVNIHSSENPDGTFDAIALLRGGYEEDRVDINRTHSGTLNLYGNTLAMRRLSGQTIARIDTQLRALLGWPNIAVPAMDRETFRDFEPFDYDPTAVADTAIEGVTTQATGLGRVDAFNSSYFKLVYNGDNVDQTDVTSQIVLGTSSKSSGSTRSGFVRGQLHRDGYTARGQFGDVDIVETITEEGIPGGTAHAGNPEHLLNSSDMYLDADGRWRYLFDTVFLPVETA